MIAELGRRPLVRPDGPWRWRLSVGAKISYLDSAAATTSQRKIQETRMCFLVNSEPWADVTVAPARPENFSGFEVRKGAFP